MQVLRAGCRVFGPHAVIRPKCVSKPDTKKLKPNGQIVIIMTGPFGAGKDTIGKELLKDPSLNITKPSRYTTRKPREKEVDGIDYHFITKEKFEKMIKEDAFFQWEIVNQNGFYYGTSYSNLQEIFNTSKSPLCVIGFDEIDKLKESLTKEGVTFTDIFISPISKEDLTKPEKIEEAVKLLEARMLQRRREPDHGERVEKIRRWLTEAQKCSLIVENKDGKLDEAIREVREILQKAKIS